MSNRYTLTDCYTLLQVDPKTFRRWLTKAQMTPQVSRGDDRVKFLTQEQVTELAKLHDRELPEAIPQQEATLAPGTYKLVLDQIEELEQAQQETGEQLQALQKTVTGLSEEVHQLRTAQDVQRTSLETLRVLTEHRFKETDQVLKEQERGLRSQIEELQTDTRKHVEQVSQSVTRLTEQREQQQQETQQFTEKIASLELALAKITEVYEKEQEARQALEQQVTTLLAARKSRPQKNRESQGNSGKL